MSVSVVNIAGPIVVNKKSNKNTGIAATAGVGGLSGLALRQFLPVTKPEIDTVMFGETNTLIDNNIKQAKNSIVSETAIMLGKDKENSALNLFLDRIKASVALSNAQESGDKNLVEKAVQMSKNAKEKIKSAPETIQKEVKELTRRAINKVKAARFLSESTIKATVKQQRPYAAFVLPGVALGALAGFVYNVVGIISDKD